MSLLILKEEALRFSLIALESYRILSGTLLVLFVPGICGDHKCDPIENYTNGSTLFRYVTLINVITLISFLALYGIEIRREYRLTRYLLATPTLPTDSESVSKEIGLLKEDKKEKLQKLTNIYRIIGITTLCSFLINTLFSGYVIITEYGSDRGPVMVVTNTILIGSKLYDIYMIITAEKNVFFSAYKKTHLQFNSANPLKCGIRDDSIVIS